MKSMGFEKIDQRLDEALLRLVNCKVLCDKLQADLTASPPAPVPVVRRGQGDYIQDWWGSDESVGRPGLFVRLGQTLARALRRLDHE